MISRYRSIARSMAGASGGGFRMASAKARWSSTDKRMICVSSIVRCAASWAAATTKSLTLRPWISAARFHPINLILGTISVDVILLMAGISPNIMLWVGPFTTFHSAFVHANLSWTLGPFKYVLATPVFHRWHHTALEEGGNTNFAGTFPIWDVLFGTFRMPENRMPASYGKDEAAMPTEILGQIAFPFRRR